MDTISYRRGITPLKIITWSFTGFIVFIFVITSVKCTFSTSDIPTGPREVIKYSIPEEKRVEAAKLYTEIYRAAMDNGSTAGWATESAEKAVERVYGMKEVSREIRQPEKARK